MEEQMTSYSRSRQVMTLLKEYGPLSFRTIRWMLNPPIKERRLHDSLARMRRRRYLVRRHEGIFRNAYAFYQLAQDSVTLNVLAEKLKCSTDSLAQPYFRNRELLHSDACACWAHFIRQQFPNAKIVRDYELRHDAEAKRAMLLDDANPELSPDIVVLFKNELGWVKTTIAIEIERTRKSDQRLVAKLKKYSSSTLIDGVIYVCSSDMILNAVSAVYRNKVLERAHRIRQYGDHFLMFASAEESGNDIGTCMINSKTQTINFSDWVAKLRTTSCAARRDEKFSMSAKGG